MRLAGYTEQEIDNADVHELVSMQKAMSTQFDILGRLLVLHAEYSALLNNPPRNAEDKRYQNALKEKRDKLMGVYNPVLTENKHKEIIELGERLYSRYLNKRGANQK